VTGDNFSLFGRIVNQSKNPQSGLIVSAFDKDGASDSDFLGKSVTDASGKFSIEFNTQKFKKWWELFEETPDVYLVIHDQQGLELLKTRIKSTKQEIEYLIKLQENDPDPNSIDIYQDNFNRFGGQLGSVGMTMDWENSINLDTLASGQLSPEVRKRLEEFRDGYLDRRNMFNILTSIINGTTLSLAEERDFNIIGYDGAQVPRLPRRQRYNQVIIWPREESSENWE